MLRSAAGGFASWEIDPPPGEGSLAEDGTVALVVPCYNEAERLDVAAFLEAAATRPWLTFLFVDDGSTDRTAEVLEAAARAAPRQISVLSLARNGGKAEAVRRGVLAALETDAELTGYWDADLATPLGELDGMRRLALDEGALVVMGVRVPLRGRAVERRRVRHYLGRVFANVASLALAARFYDTQCGAKLLRNDEVIRAVFSAPFRARWVFDVEVLARILRHDLRSGSSLLATRVLELPLSEWHDVQGSKLRPHDFLRAGVDLAGVALSTRLAARARAEGRRRGRGEGGA